MKSIILLLLISALASFAQIQPTDKGIVVSVKNQNWLWLSFPDTNNPVPLTASVTTTVQPVVTKLGDKWQIKFGLDTNGKTLSALDAKLAANEKRNAEISKEVNRIKDEYFVRTGKRLEMNSGNTTPEYQQIMRLNKESGDLLQERYILQAKKRLDQK
jgi:hypothetical protein